MMEDEEEEDADENVQEGNLGEGMSMN
jgi:hypothetical protein